MQEKREKTEAAKLPSERRAIPPAPPELENDLPTSAPDIDAFNSRMFDYYNNRSEAALPILQFVGHDPSVNTAAVQPHDVWTKKRSTATHRAPCSIKHDII